VSKRALVFVGVVLFCLFFWFGVFFAVLCCRFCWFLFWLFFTLCEQQLGLVVGCFFLCCCVAVFVVSFFFWV